MASVKPRSTTEVDAPHRGYRSPPTDTPTLLNQGAPYGLYLRCTGHRLFRHKKRLTLGYAFYIASGAVGSGIYPSSASVSAQGYPAAFCKHLPFAMPSPTSIRLHRLRHEWMHKPGSVSGDEHPMAVIPLGHASPHVSSVLPGSRAGHTIAPLFGLAPGGVLPAAVSPRRWCALTAPFHPCRPRCGSIAA